MSTELTEGAPQTAKRGQVSPWKFVFMAYFVMCGGPFGLEEAVRGAYPLLCILFVLVLPLLYAIPLALITAELGCMFPTNDGVVEWVNKAFGNRFSFVINGAAFVNYALDLAIYPVLFVNYLDNFAANISQNTAVNIGTPLGLMALLLIANIFGVDFVLVKIDEALTFQTSSISSVLALFIVLLFLVMFVWAAAVGKMNPKDWVKLPPGEWNKDKLIKVSGAFNIVLWSYTGCDSLGQILEDLEDLNKNYNRILLGGIFLTTLTYVISIVGMLSLDDDYEQWKSGYFSVLAGLLGGKVLEDVVIVSAMIGNVGIYNSLLLPGAEQLQALCGENYLNIKWMTWKHPKYHTPVPSLIVTTIAGMCLIRLSFDSLIQLQSLVYGVVVIVICSSVIKLRISQPERHRPYKLLNTDRLPIVILVAMGPICLSFYIIATVCIGDWAYGVALLLIWLLLFVWHGLCSIRKEFNEIEEDEVRKGLVN